MTENACNIMIGGEAGQGIVTVGVVLAKALVRAGYSVVVTQSYHSRIRGGHNTFSIRVSAEPIAAPQEAVDLLVALNAETIVLHAAELSPRGLVVTDESHEHEAVGASCLRVPFDTLASGPFASAAALAVAASLLGLDQGLVRTALADFFGEKHPELVGKNRAVLEKTFSWIADQAVSFGKLPPAADASARVMLNGNEAIALGALSAGAKFCSFYPMTPATSIALTLVKHAAEAGLVCEQAEDEIAAISMALGASFAGAPAIVPTSGGGFALMTEGVSLAAMTETPVVIAVAQRPGPATGLPTRTEQADLEFVLHAGHGEFPRAIFAPGRVEECFTLARKAMELAEKYQGPVFLLTDQFLADSYRAVRPCGPEHWPPVGRYRAPENVTAPYRRFAFTENGVSPRLVPGAARHLVAADSDEHTEDGHITEDLGVRVKMVEKRLKKLEGLCAETVPPAFDGDDAAELLLVTWGSSAGSVREAVDVLRARGERAAALSFSQVWPLAPDQFLARLEGAKDVVAVEGNATAQFARLIRRETGFHIARRVLRYDGLPITPEYILRTLGEEA